MYAMAYLKILKVFHKLLIFSSIKNENCMETRFVKLEGFCIYF